jgi:hypothetical protein
METHVREVAADWFVGVMMAAFGLIGLVLASGARDTEMSVFGWSLVGFAVLFDWVLIKRYYDTVDAIYAGAEAAHHDAEGAAP